MRISDWSSDVGSSDLRAVLQDILGLWLGELDRLTEERDPATALADYIRAKVRLSRERPLASKVYANEMIRGARHTGDFLKNELRSLVTSKAKVLEAWAGAGKIEPVDGRKRVGGGKSVSVRGDIGGRRSI